MGRVYARAGGGSIRATNVAGGFDGETGRPLSLEQTGQGSVRPGNRIGAASNCVTSTDPDPDTGGGSIKADGKLRASGACTRGREHTASAPEMHYST